MITRREMFTPLLEAYPDFSTQNADFVREYEDEDYELPSYMLLSDLARECSRIYAAGQIEELEKIFEVAEKWHVEGDDYVREAATVGFLEGLQNTNLHKATSPADFVRFLGPESFYWWHKLERFWSHGELLVDDRKKLSMRFGLNKLLARQR